MTTGTKKDESDFQEQVIAFLRSKGAYPIKVHVGAYESQGEPDVVCCYLGRFIAFELKVKGNKASKLQEHKIKKIIKSGGIAASVYTINEIEDTLHEVFRIQYGGKPSE